MSEYDYKAIDAVVNIWNEDALRQRPGWGDDFFVKKMKRIQWIPYFMHPRVASADVKIPT